MMKSSKANENMSCRRFVQTLVSSIQNNNYDELCNVVKESKVNKDKLRKEPLPDYFLDTNVIDSFYKIMQPEYLENLYHPAISIFYHLYAGSNHRSMTPFYEKQFIISLWEHVENTQGKALYYTIKTLFTLTDGSKDFHEKVMSVIPSTIKSMMTDFQHERQPNEFYFILTELLLFISKHYFQNIPFAAIMQTILSLFKYFELEFISEEMFLTVFQAFQNMISIYLPHDFFAALKSENLQTFLFDKFYFCDSRNIFYGNAHLLSLLFDLIFKWKQIKIDLKIHQNSLIKAFNELQYVVTLPTGDPNFENAQYLINLISKFFLYFRYHPKKVFSPFNPYLFVVQENVVELMMEIFHNFDHNSIEKGMEFVNILFFTPKSRIDLLFESFLKSDILEIVSKLLDSDAISVIEIACRFLSRICFYWVNLSKRNYPLAEKLHSYGITENIEGLISIHSSLTKSNARFAKKSIQSVLSFIENHPEANNENNNENCDENNNENCDENNNENCDENNNENCDENNNENCDENNNEFKDEAFDKFVNSIRENVAEYQNALRKL